MTPNINMERSAGYRAGLLSISSGVVSGARLTGWLLPLHRPKRQNTNTKKAPGGDGVHRGTKSRNQITGQEPTP